MPGQDIGHNEVVFGSESALDMALCRMSNVECRMSKMVRKRLEPCQKSLQRLSDVALCARKGKEKGK